MKKYLRILIVTLVLIISSNWSFAGDTHDVIMSGFQDSLVIVKLKSKVDKGYRATNVKFLMGEKMPDEIIFEVEEHYIEYMQFGKYYLLPLNKQFNGVFFSYAPFKALSYDGTTLKLTEDKANFMAYELQQFVNEGKYVEADKKAVERKEKEKKDSEIKDNEIQNIQKQAENKSFNESKTKGDQRKMFIIIVIFVLVGILTGLMFKFRDDKKISILLLVIGIGLVAGILFYAYYDFLGEEQKESNIGSSPITKTQRDAKYPELSEGIKSSEVQKAIIINPSGDKIVNRFNVPEGFERINTQMGSYGEYLRNLPLKPSGEAVRYFDGRQKPKNVHEGVLDIDVGKTDLQQCADAVMRLWAEYNYKNGKYEKIHFNFTNGFRAEYSKWREGNIIRVSGNDAKWEKTLRKLTTYKSFREYLDMVFSYAGTLSLSQEMMKVSLQEMQIGDIFLKGNDPGHCVLIVDMAKNLQTGKKIFMIAQSYMPAQDIHILKNNEEVEISPWYNADFGDELITPEWIFKKDQLYRFSE